MTKPLILSPAGSYESLVAAVNAGADEVYFGFGEFNARYNAKNFTDEEFEKAINLCKILGVKTNITMNTLLTDREIPKALDMVYKAACMGADAFIVQDLGFASRIKKEMPQVLLHASTQCACHNLEGARMLSELGFSRVVLAREMPSYEIKKITDAGIETEIFVHGALCVCHSGMCLMSSVIGKRSGNRGLCAQPCRLPYKLDNCKNTAYPLSLKDLSTANHIEDILSLGVSSLKIEGRMKSPDYVYNTTKIWREMLDEGVNADKDKMTKLEKIFSRGGFTDKYFTGEYTDNNKSMYGVRSEADKENSRLESNKKDFEMQEKKRKISISCFISEGEKIRAFADADNVTAEYISDFEAPSARELPIDEKAVKEAMSKLGNTPFCVDEKKIFAEITGNVFLRKSMLNSVRRGLCENLEKALTKKADIDRTVSENTKMPLRNSREANTLYSCKDFYTAMNITGGNVCFPLYELCDMTPEKSEKLANQLKGKDKVGVKLPRVIFDSEKENCVKLLCLAKELGISFVMVSNIGHVKYAKDSTLEMISDIGMNVFNSETAHLLENMGFETVTVSPELNEAQIRDIGTNKAKICAFVKGRLPLMVLESCIIKANGNCKNQKTGERCGVLCDRIGKEFEIYGERRLDGKMSCRNIIYNSVEADITSNKEKLEKMNPDTVMIML